MILTTLKQWMLAALLGIGSVTAYAQDVNMTYPQAEWSKAGDILMHTPGRELFCGVIHPSAGLFEDYFDVDKAAEEHRGYIAMLEANGIRVHTVMDILQEVGIDSLRALADNVLIYDISGIPEENPEATEEYRQDVLSKMSRADLIRCILLQPMVKLWRTDNNTGYKATYILNPLMNLYFTRDQSITTPRGHVICNMNSSQRSPETNIIELCYNHLGLKPILHIEGEGRMEAKPGDPEYDTCDIWARQPGTKDYSLWKQDLPFVDYIKSRGFEIIPIDVDDEMHYANNFLTIAPRHIMAVGAQSEELQQRFREAGVNVEWIPLESLIGGYGAAHCMTQVLQREAYDPTPTGINAVRLYAPADGKAYRLDGIPTTPNTRGIVVEDRKLKVVKFE
jgi:arginine deiminase